MQNRPWHEVLISPYLSKKGSIKSVILLVTFMILTDFRLKTCEFH